MEQNTDEWREWRHDKIGGSDASIIMGVSKYLKRDGLLLQKTTPFEDLKEKESSPVAMMGHAVEELERPRYEFLMGKKFMPALMTHPEIPWLSASFDGLTMDETEAWEHKLVGKDTFAEVEHQVLPAKFKPQLMHQFLVNQKLKQIHLCCVLYQKSFFGKMEPSGFIRTSMIVERDDKYIKEELMPALNLFRQDVLAKKDFSHLDVVAKELSETKEQIKILKSKQDELEERLKQELFNVGKVSTNKFRYSYVLQKKSETDLKSICKDYNVDLNKYKIEGKPFYRLDVKPQK